jgi:hypothetical protein
VVGATQSDDTAAVEAFRSKSGASYPMLYGLEASVKEAYGVKGYPAVRVIGKDGRLIGDSLEALEEALH